MGNTVTIDADELLALRILARKALSSSESHGESPLDGPVDDGNDSHPDEEDHPTGVPSHLARTITWQELNVVESLVMARGAIVPANRILRHIHNTGKLAIADQWVEAPSSQVTRARQHCRHKFGTDCIETVWNMRVNSKGRIVRDWKAGIRGYRWIGPDVYGSAEEVAGDLLGGN